MDTQKKQRKLNIIDLIVILLLLAATAFLIIRGIQLYRAARVLEEDPKEERVNACLMPEDFTPNFRFTVVCKEVDAVLAQSICESEYRRLYSSFALLDAYVSDISPQPSVLTTVNAAGKELQTQSSTLTDLTFTIDAKIDLANPTSVIDGNFNPLVSSQEVRLGKLFSLKTMGFEQTGTVMQMETLHADD